MNPLPAATRPRATSRRAGLLAVAGILAALALPQAASAAGTTMSPDTVTPVADPGVTLAVPADGRVNGYQFTAHILGAATGTAMPTPDGTRAGAGQRLWVFGLAWSADRILDGNGATRAVAQVTATLVYAGTRLTVPLNQPPTPTDELTAPVDSGDEYFLASLPAKTADVELELANGGFAQDFSLSHMARTGTQPAVLYRNPSGWQTVQPLTLSKSLPTPYTATQDNPALAGAAMTVSLESATLSYFAPDGPTDTPADPGKAWLIPDLEDPVPQPMQGAFQNLNYTTHALASGITLTLPDGTVIPAKDFPGGGPDYPTYSGNDNNDVFVDRYAFQVPAGITAATITVALPPEVAYPDYGFTAPSQTYTLPPVKFAVTLPAAQPVPPAAGASDHPALIRAATNAGTATDATNSRSGGSGFPWWAIVVIIVLAVGAAGAVWVSRRRRHASAAPAKPTGPTATTDEPPPPSPPPPPAPATAAVPSVVYPTEIAGTASGAPAGTATMAPPVETNGHDAPGDDEPPVAQMQPGSFIPVPAQPNGFEAGLDQPLPSVAPSPEGSSEETGDHAGVFDLDGSDPLDGFNPPSPPPMSERALYVFDKMTFRHWAEPPDRNPVVDIVFYLATHPGRPVSRDTLRTISGSEAADPVRNTLRSNASRARKALGDGYLPKAGAGGYQLTGVDCDLTVIDDLSGRAAAAERAGNLDEAVDLYGRAVALIVGRPFESERTYAWVDKEGLGSDAEKLATRTAHNLARLALGADRPQLALWAARQGMQADPYDQTLINPAITAAKRCGRNPALRAEWTAITRKLKALGVEIDPELIDLYRRLLEEPDD